MKNMVLMAAIVASSVGSIMADCSTGNCSTRELRVRPARSIASKSNSCANGRCNVRQKQVSHNIKTARQTVKTVRQNSCANGMCGR